MTDCRVCAVVLFVLAEYVGILFVFMECFVTRSATFQLIPFAQEANGNVAVTGRVSRNGCHFTLNYQLSGDIDSLLFPDRVAAPSRCDELWRSTCCECFVRVAGHPEYYELNVSPNGNWNAYHFTGYREGMQEETAVADLDVQVSREGGVFLLYCAFQLDGIFESGDDVDIGVSCVLTHSNGTTSYWALSHPGLKPDFHHPEAFMLRL